MNTYGSWKRMIVWTVEEMISSFPGEDIPTKIVCSGFWIEDCIAVRGNIPKSYELLKLADWLLSDELKDTSRSKVQNTEYPFLSKSQIERRYRELSMTAEIVDSLHLKKMTNQPTRKKDSMRNEY